MNVMVAIAEKMLKLDVYQFDITFLDGDHSEISFWKDWWLSEQLTLLNGYILVDDITNEDHELHKVYPSLKEKNNFYEYDNWNPRPDMALILNKEFDYVN